MIFLEKMQKVEELIFLKILSNTSFIYLVLIKKSSKLQRKYKENIDRIAGFSQNGCVCLKSDSQKSSSKKIFIEGNKKLIGLFSKEG